MKSVVVAGAGPAGLAAAVHLRRAGRSVEVFERRDDVGARFINEYQILESYSRPEDALTELSSMGIEVNFDCRPATWAKLYEDRSRGRRVESLRPYGYFVRRGPERGTLDRGLADQALALGARIHFGRRLAVEEADVVATGPGPADGIAKEIAFRTTSPDRIDVVFDPDLAPGGYAYFFALAGRGTLGVALLKGYAELEAQFEKTRERFQSFAPFDVEDERPGYSYMNFFLHRSSVHGGSRFAGEAGGFQDYLFGLGIRYALVSGHLAARSVVEEVHFDRLWAGRFGGAMRSSLTSRLLYESLGRYGLRFFVWRAARSDFRDFLQSWAKPAWWRVALAPLAERAFGRAERCAHKIPCSWCRPRDGRQGGRDVLPADFVARYLEKR